ncbi:MULTISPECIES: hypothetical protein [Helicobacter]|uniref:DUF904 domain-containing protein n=1 Tax=Helicobacter equorum TaxID=361872 RepID=A0A3D8IUD9_9HELI|nr:MULTISPECIES: hypothetical protein [Helicobacter]MBR2111905.1 hypothetical protein [Helicobacter sp.]MCI6313631.1 hypothetical protein [Helicobacter sp.]MCI7711086.1 hypothetical protein [Helicobacter sp.]MDD7345848.1 hypothetical protein [Helicobacter sp.]MDY2823345.1 hypothetical protein [Helicobacter sp.]
MDTQIMEKFSQKIEEMLQKMNAQKLEIDSLRTKVRELEADNQAKDTQISNLYDLLGSQKKGIEDLFSKIEEGLRYE